MRFLWRVHGVTLRDRVRNCEIRKALNVDPLLRIERSQLPWFGHCLQNDPQKISEANPAGYTHGKAEFVQGPGGVTTSPTLLGHVLVWSQQNYLRLLLTVRYFESSYDYCPRGDFVRSRPCLLGQNCFCSDEPLNFCIFF